jgi:hypothetical protein
VQIGSHLNINISSTQGLQGSGQPGQSNQNPIMQALSNTLKMSPQQLRSDLQAGDSLQQIAQDQGVSASDVQSALSSAIKAANQNGQLSDQQAQSMLNLVNGSSFGSSPNDVRQLMGMMRGGHHHHHASGANAAVSTPGNQPNVGPAATYESTQLAQELVPSGS